VVLPASHPGVVQLTTAWRTVTEQGLAGNPGEASIRYRVLAHAANALAELADIADIADGGTEWAALKRLGGYALIHSTRLYATAGALSSRSATGGAYPSRLAAEDGARAVEQRYQAWASSPAAVRLSQDTRQRSWVRELHAARDRAVRYRFTDDPGCVSAWYQDLSTAASRVVAAFPVTMPSAELTGLLWLQMRAPDHAYRLMVTAARGGYGALPEPVASATALARTSNTERTYRAPGADQQKTAERDWPLRRDRPARTERGELSCVTATDGRSCQGRNRVALAILGR
jgi:hypothetical protein